MQKGYQHPNTLEKVAAREYLGQRIRSDLDPIYQAMSHAAKGISHFMLRDKETGQWKRVEDPQQIVDALNDPDAQEGSTYYIYTKDPDMKAAGMLLDRGLDKAQEPEQQVTHSGKIEIMWKG
jgi:hypothetical protein